MNRKNIFLSLSFLIAFVLMFGCAANTASNDDDDDNNDNAAAYTKTLDERYVELQYKGIGGAAIYSWNYNAKNELEEFSQYFYDTAGRNSMIKSYSSETTSDSNYLGKYVYTYDGTTYNIAKCELFNSSGSLVQVYEATYNASGKYLTYISKDSTGNVLESRVSTYNTDGYYVKETYYSDAVNTVKLEEYTCTYDGATPGKYIEELRYNKTPTGTTSGTDNSTDSVGSYESTTKYTFSWGSNPAAKSHYLQQSFDENGNLLDMIQYIYNADWKKTSRSFFSTGKLQSYRTYSYSEDGTYLTDETYYDKKDRVVNLFSYRYTTRTDTHVLYEKTVYSYSYPDDTSSKSIFTYIDRVPDFSKSKAPAANHFVNR